MKVGSLIPTNDPDVVRQGLRLYLRQDPEIEPVGEAAVEVR